ncbi:MAG: hypothetical protein LBK27_01650 [Treponema sp.]|nr:hypothetical protein [Treponema sp.]
MIPDEPTNTLEGIYPQRLLYPLETPALMLLNCGQYTGDSPSLPPPCFALDDGDEDDDEDIDETDNFDDMEDDFGDDFEDEDDDFEDEDDDYDYEEDVDYDDFDE